MVAAGNGVDHTRTSRVSVTFGPAMVSVTFGPAIAGIPAAGQRGSSSSSSIPVTCASNSSSASLSP